MPIVPQRSPLPIDSTPLRRPLPGVRVIPNAPEDAFGPPALPNLTGVQQQVADIYQREKAKANQIAVNDADNKATSLRDQVLWGTQEQPGILAKKGQDAMAGVGDAIQQWNTGVGEITNGLSNDEQKLAFQNRIAGYDHALHEQVQAHVAAEHQRYDTDTTNAYVQNRVNDAVQNSGNPQLSEQNVDYAKAAIGDFAKRNGWSTEQLQEQQQKVTSQIRFGVIEKMATGGQDLDAQQYLAAHNSELLPTQLEQAQRLTNASSVLGEGQRQAQSILGSATSLSDAVKQAEGLTDPKVQEETKRLLRQHFEDQATSERLDRDQTFEKSWQTVQQNGGDYNALPIADRLKMSPTQVEQLQKGADSIRHPVRRTDASTYTNLVNQASLNAASRAEFAHTNLMNYQSKLSDADYRYLVRLQGSILRGDDRSQTAAEARLHRNEEAATIKQLDTFQKTQAGIAHPVTPLDSTRAQLAADSALASPSLSGYRLTRPTVPQWMADSAKTDPEYMDHLMIHGYDPKSNPVKPSRQQPKAPGAPIQ